MPLKGLLEIQEVIVNKAKREAW